jgi:hypothetical protein
MRKHLTIAVDLIGTLQMPDGGDVPGAWGAIRELMEAGVQFVPWADGAVRSLFAEQMLIMGSDSPEHRPGSEIDYFVGPKCIGCPTSFDTKDPLFPDFVDWENVKDMIMRHQEKLSSDYEFSKEQKQEADQSAADAD